jgi:hypothetical protein
MQRLKQGRQTIDVSHVLLYLEDFFAIVQLFREHCEAVEVTADGFLLDDPQGDIIQLKDQIHRLKVLDL